MCGEKNAQYSLAFDRLADFFQFPVVFTKAHRNNTSERSSSFSVLLTHTKLQAPSCEHMVVQSKVLTGPSSPINSALEKVGTVKSR